MDGKRIKIENPIQTLLYAIKTQVSGNLRAHHLQTLLFFIDQHWEILHIDRRQEVFDTLLQFISFEDTIIQSWSFVCIAAITHAEGTSGPSEVRDTPSQNDRNSTKFADWDAVWTHAVRRLNVPLVCRAACHLASVLLIHSDLLSPSRVHSEIEACAKDLDVQGPALPYDAVCTFLGHCLRIASRDVRLYRMQMEEKVLTWLLDNWRPGSEGRFKMPLHSVNDILMLLASICSLSKRVDVICFLTLPCCSVVDAVVEEKEDHTIRQFTLYGRLPPLRTSRRSPGSDAVDMDAPSHGFSEQSNSQLLQTAGDFTQPSARERRTSAFFAKSLEDLNLSWDTNKTKSGIAAERLRSYLDFSVTALLFEGLVLWNGTRLNKRVIQQACKFIKLIIPVAAERHWTSEERILILSALRPLFTVCEQNQDTTSWETMISPTEDSGVRHSVLRTQQARFKTGSSELGQSRRGLQFGLFQIPEVSYQSYLRSHPPIFQ